MTDSEDRLINLEMTIAHQDKVIAELSDVINAQWKEIESLKRELLKTNAKIDDLNVGEGRGDEANVKPPHW